MWRPFAGSFVEHSLESFIVKHERGKSSLVYSPKPQNFSTKTSPFQLCPEDLKKRLENFKRLKKKVLKQRVEIKKNDSLYDQKVEVHLRYKRKPKLVLLEERKQLKLLTIKRKSEGLETEQDVRRVSILTNGGDLNTLPLIKRKSSQ